VHDFEANCKHGRHKRHEIVTPTNIRVSLGDDHFYDIESCSIEPAKLDEVVLLNFFPLFLLFFFVDKGP